MNAIARMIRLDEWKASKLNPLFVGACLAAATQWAGWSTAWSIVGFMLVIVFNASFGYAINNFCDVDVDRAAGKRNSFSDMSRASAVAIVLALLGAGLAIAAAAFWAAPAAIAWTVLSFGFAAAYSARPLRLKERGVVGLATSSLAQRVVPLFIIFSAVGSWSVLDWVYVVLAFIVGVRFILIHQIHDLEHDRETGVATFLTARGIDVAQRAILLVVGPLELLALIAVAVLVGLNSWILGVTLGAVILAYIALQVVRLGFTTAYREVNFSYLGYNSIYTLALPLIVAAGLIPFGLPATPVIAIALVLIAPEVRRLVLGAVSRISARAARRREENSRVTVYPHPVGILLFNRPEYARQFLQSLVDQDLRLDMSRVVVHVDAYPGSRDEARGTANATAETVALAREFLPDAHVIVANRNVGIAQAYEVVESTVVNLDNAEWLTFFEEDFVLHPNYLRAMLRAIELVDVQPEVVMVSATGDSRATNTQGFPLVAQLHLWAFSIRRSHVTERRPLVTRYLEAISTGQYWQRNDATIWHACASVGLFPMGTSQDYIKRAAMRKMGRIALTTAIPYGYYVGERGEHFTPRAYELQGYGQRPPATSDLPSITSAADMTALIAQATDDFDVMMSEEGVRDIIDPFTATRAVTHSSARWKALDDQLFLEGPFPDLGLYRPFVWLTGNSCDVALEVTTTGRYRVHALVANSLPGQVATLTLGHDSTTMDVPPTGPHHPATLVLECDLVAGENIISIAYTKAESAPGDTRELALMLYDLHI